MHFLLSIQLFALIITGTLAAPVSPRFRLWSTTEEQYLRVTSDGTVRVDGHKMTEEAREATCFRILRPKRFDAVLLKKIGDELFTVVVDSNGQVLALPEEDVHDSESGSGVVYNKVFKWQPSCGSDRRAICLGARVPGKTDCYLHFDANGLAANACSSDAAQNKETFLLERCR